MQMHFDEKKPEVQYFKKALKNINVLYLFSHVIILVDLDYFRRFSHQILRLNMMGAYCQGPDLRFCVR